MSIATMYRRFAESEAHGVSGMYEEWACGVAEDLTVQALLGTLPPGKGQPNLVFAAARSQGAPLGNYQDFRNWLLGNWQNVDPVIRTRSTQTNEAGRCAVLLSQLAAIEGPVALLEVGASAGLCLYPDRYSYTYRQADRQIRVDPPRPTGVVLECELRGDATAPTRVPEVVWRAGIDLNPLDVTAREDLQWLEALIWPEHEVRRQRLRTAAAVVAADPPRLVAGDLNREIGRLARQAPPEATLVIFHSAVLTYLTPGERQEFVDQVSALDCIWLSNEGQQVLPGIAARMPRAATVPDGAFVLAANGHPVAFTGPHGQYIHSLS
ncbi:DUF2332 domain-containing protein [Arthrobacter sp. ATA002]|uniref:DUF2332 domain-containing protein n=1 Tax=Arthrobacter sp. ATA002 TaxID=2991715 RepID=UPI0022A73C09|nr:DUF2332 domain-containing protein [Arthrobacter sp. ATA002]WAP50583.1 DUF2332 domain-containing protein [Arthrobacter sp. ATA002]